MTDNTKGQSQHGDCPECSAPLLFKSGKKGSFLGCSNYPDCQFIHNFGVSNVDTLKVMEGSSCPECGSALAVKKGRFGMFIGCTDFPECNYVQSEQKQQEDESSVYCPQCSSGKLIKRKGRKGKPFYSCNNYPSCKYLLNEEPIEQNCPACDWPVMVLKNKGEQQFIVCPQRECGHSMEFDKKL